MIEREKRWRLKGDIPTDKIVDKFIISQTYSNFNPDVRIRKIRRKNNEEYSHCVKYNLQNNEHEEVEQKISKERYERIFSAINKNPVIKERIVVDIGDSLFAEIDRFEDTGDIIIEVEFKTEDIMHNFKKPDWFGNEIKKNKSFSVEIFKQINKNTVSIWD